jgi:hypothetical protein
MEPDWYKSSASCKLSDIKGILYGGISSRFWMMRKHINSIPIDQLKKGNLPFYCWECITLQMGHRDVDLVIKDEKDMMKFIALITFSSLNLGQLKNTAS